MTDSGFEIPPDHIASQIRSTLDRSSPVITLDVLLFVCRSCRPLPYPR
jgi:hypothetical protein